MKKGDRQGLFSPIRHAINWCTRIDTETDIDILRQKAALLHRENDLLHTRLADLTAQLDKLQGGDGAALQQELAYLKERMEAQSRALFGKSSEKRKVGSNGQPEPAAKPERPAQTGHGPREQPKLPNVEEVHELDEADKICPSCGGALSPMGEQFEEADEIDVVERTFRIVRHKRQKYRCQCQACIDTALGPAKHIRGGRYSLRFAVHVAVDKYALHMPLTRQCQEMAHQGLEVDSQTLWDQTNGLAKAKAAHPDDEAAWLQQLGEVLKTESAAVLAEIRTWRQGLHVLPKSALGRAVKYMDDNWLDLGLFVGDARIALDNNDAERGMRRLAVGRKNHYGSKSLRGTQVAAVFYSLIESAHRLGLDPKGYLLAVATAAIADPKAVLLPRMYAEQLKSSA